MAPRLFVILLALAPAAQAETYKWVDERGVVNYSNTPPPSVAKAPQQVADRVSTYQTDPALRAVVARGVTPYETMLHQEWLQRQRLMADAEIVKAAYTPPVDDGFYSHRAVYGYPYGGGYGYRRPYVNHRSNSGRDNGPRGGRR
jgi:hypothetical protein